MWLEISNLRLAEKEFRLSYEPVEISKLRREIMNNKIYNYGMYLFRIIALVVMSVITFAGIADAEIVSNVVEMIF